MRLYELARELGVPNKNILDLALSVGVNCRNHATHISEHQADLIRQKLNEQTPTVPSPKRVLPPLTEDQALQINAEHRFVGNGCSCGSTPVYLDPERSFRNHLSKVRSSYRKYGKYEYAEIQISNSGKTVWFL